MNECPFKEDRTECTLAKGGMSCDLCKRQALDMQAAEHVETKERVIKNWKRFKKWFDDLVEENKVSINQETKNSYTMIRNVMDAMLRLKPIEPEFEDTLYVFKLEILNDMLDSAEIDPDDEENQLKIPE